MIKADAAELLEVHAMTVEKLDAMQVRLEELAVDVKGQSAELLELHTMTAEKLDNTHVRLEELAAEKSLVDGLSLLREVHARGVHARHPARLVFVEFHGSPVETP